MNFQSILFAPGAAATKDDIRAPEFFHDLNLDQIVAGITEIGRASCRERVSSKV